MTDPRLQELADETRAMIARAEKVGAERDAALAKLEAVKKWIWERRFGHSRDDQDAFSDAVLDLTDDLSRVLSQSDTS